MNNSPNLCAKVSMKERVVRCNMGRRVKRWSREEAECVGFGCVWGGVRERIREVRLRMVRRGVVTGTVVGRVKNARRRRSRRRALPA